MSTLIEINIVLSLVFLGYYLFLRNLTFFQANRFYLFAGMLLALFSPFLKTQKIAPVQEIQIPTNFIFVESQTTNSLSYFYYLLVLVSVISLFRFLFGLTKILNIHTNSQNETISEYFFKNSTEKINPFSFWKWIYIHKNNHSQPQLLQILKHESVHTSQRHSLDVLLVELCVILCWYNPLVYFLRKAVKQNLEYLVDNEVLKSGFDKISYQHSLIGISVNNFPSYGNEFAFQSLKKRIQMMNTKKTSPTKLSAFLVLIPAIAFISISTISCQKESDKVNETIGITNDKSGNAIIANKDKPLVLLDGKEIDDINTIKPDDIESVSVFKDFETTSKYGLKEGGSVILITSKKR